MSSLNSTIVEMFSGFLEMCKVSAPFITLDFLSIFNITYFWNVFIIFLLVCVCVCVCISIQMPQFLPHFICHVKPEIV